MENFSLEDDEYQDLFLTQEDKGNCNVNEEEDEESYKFFGLNADDFSSPMVSLVEGKEGLQHYSDISDKDIEFKQSDVREDNGEEGGATSDKKLNVGHGIARLSGWKTRSQIGRKLGFAASKTVSNLKRFKKVTDDRLKDLKTDKMKKRTFHKVQWGVRAFKDWCSNRMSDVNGFDPCIYEYDLDRVDLLERDSFEYAMCRFLAEVRKVDGSDYPGKTLYHLVVSIQKHINSKGKNWKLIETGQFSQIRVVLNNLMKERAKANIGMTKRQAEFIESDIEEKLWSSGQLGEDTPDKLRNTVLFLVGLNVGLRAGDEHYYLRRDVPGLESQFKFKRNENGVRCLVYEEDTTTKCNDGGLNHMRKERKVVWVYPSSNSERCPVRLIDKYISLLPPTRPNVSVKKPNFYLRSLEKFTPAQWYGEQVVGLNSLRKVMSDICEKAGIKGFITNHSLRRTGTTKLFRSGVDCKLIKEFTGHTSDAVDAYAITSHEQREKISKILNGSEKVDKTVKNDDGKIKPVDAAVEVGVCERRGTNNGESVMYCQCNKQRFKVGEADKLGDMITQLLNSHKGGKATVKVEIEFGD